MFTLLLILTVLFSYGQTLGMGVWQDDNGLFFKLAHISENAGYLSAGPFGSGAYKYIHTPYIPIYSLFGFNTFAYFAVSIIFYALATILIFKIFKSILGENGGRIAGFIYAAGFIASDGFIRLFNTVVTSVSVMIIGLLVWFYWKFSKNCKPIWYFLALLMYFFAVEFVIGRTHYLIAAVLSFEILFFAFKRPFIKNLSSSVLRTLPFIYIFYLYFIRQADHRSANVGVFLKSLAKGDFYQVYGFLSSVSNLFVPDWFTVWVSKILSPKGLWLVFSAIFLLATVYLYKKNKNKLFLAILPVQLVWIYVARSLFAVPQINPSDFQRTIPFIGSVIVFLLFCGFLLVKKAHKKIYLVLLIFTFGNIAAYSAYNPLVVYESINRYLAHSFFAVAGILGILFISTNKKAVKFLVIFFAVGNLIASMIYQSNLLKERSNPVRSFYLELKTYVGKVEKGDIFYFDVADDSRGYFADAFSVASMPETTAIAWRYDVDRYDLYRVTEFNGLISLLNEKNISANKIYSFFYSNKKLQNTTDQLRERLITGAEESKLDFSLERKGRELIISPKEPIVSTTPNRLHFDIKGDQYPSNISFPYIANPSLSKNVVAKDNTLRRLAFEYDLFKRNEYQQAGISATSSWRQNAKEGIYDGDQNTLWQADRISWGKKQPAIVTIDMKKEIEIDRLVWINAYANNSPVDYKIEVSSNESDWKPVKHIQSENRIESWQRQIITFPATKARFIRIIFTKTLNGDSPGIAEIWPVPSAFHTLDINRAEEFISDPFGFLPDKASYENTLKALKFTEEIKVSIKTNKKTQWIPVEKPRLQVLFNSKISRYSIILPAGGTQISEISLTKSIPGDIDVQSLWVKPLTLIDLEKVQ